MYQTQTKFDLAKFSQQLFSLDPNFIKEAKEWHINSELTICYVIQGPKRKENLYLAQISNRWNNSVLRWIPDNRFNLIARNFFDQIESEIIFQRPGTQDKLILSHSYKLQNFTNHERVAAFIELQDSLSKKGLEETEIENLLSF